MTTHSRLRAARRRLNGASLAVVLLGALAMTSLAARSSVAAEPGGICAGTPAPGGEIIRGPILHIPDGERVCVARGFDPATWMPLRLADVPQATARQTLMAAAFGKDAECRVTPDGAAVCLVEGRRLSELVVDESVVTAGATWREARPALTTGLVQR